MRFLLAALLPLGLWAQPAPDLQNAANLYIDHQFAPGSLLRIYLSGQSVQTVVSAQLLPAGSQTPIALPIVGTTDAYSVIALIPKNTALGPAQIHAWFNGVDQGSASVTIVPSSFGLFTNGPVALSQNSLTHPAHLNEVVTMRS